jgi:uncharacterized protein YjiS (DUF1127 family)
MSYIPMHNRFAEGFVEPESSGETLDPLSSQINSAPLAAADFEAVLHRALSARDAALAAGLVRAGRSLASVLAVPARWLIVRFLAWRQRGRDAAELYAADEHTLADLGVRRADIPFIVAHGAREWRDPRGDFMRL